MIRKAIEPLHRDYSVVEGEANLAQHQEHLSFFEEHNNVEELSHTVRFDSGRPGPLLFIGTAVHGNEPGGPEAAMILLKHLQEGRAKLSHGSIVATIANPLAYKQAERFIDVNMGRLFLPNSTDYKNPEAKRAWKVVTYIGSIKKELSKIIDLHSVSTGDTRTAVREYGNNRNNMLAEILPKSFDMHFIYKPDHLSGILADLAVMLGKDGFSFELGNHFNPAAVHRALHYIQICLEFNGMKIIGEPLRIDQSAISENQEMPHYHTIHKIVPTKNFRWAMNNPQTHIPLKKGEVYAESDTHAYKAPKDCFLVMPTKNPRDDDDDVGFLCEKEGE